jgi:hypothetical protein
MTSLAKKTGTHSPDTLRHEEPAKGGTKPADPKVHRSKDSPKPHGDQLQHAVDEAAEKRSRRF